MKTVMCCVVFKDFESIRNAFNDFRASQRTFLGFALTKTGGLYQASQDFKVMARPVHAIAFRVRTGVIPGGIANLPAWQKSVTHILLLGGTPGEALDALQAQGVEAVEQAAIKMEEVRHHWQASGLMSRVASKAIVTHRLLISC